MLIVFERILFIGNEEFRSVYADQFIKVPISIRISFMPMYICVFFAMVIIIIELKPFLGACNAPSGRAWVVFLRLIYP